MEENLSTAKLMICLMDSQKPIQRKTVQWDAQEIKTNIVEAHEEFRKKVLHFQSKVSHADDNEVSDSDKSESSQQKSQKTIQIQSNLKKARMNRMSQKLDQQINLKEINRRISLKENIKSVKSKLPEK